MIPARANPVARQLEVLWGSGTLTGLSDAQLLGRFIGGGEGAAEPAFRELLDRHGPMVMGVCRQMLRRAQDAEDAFQATFLVLVRKARSIRVSDSLAPWLYGVACRTAQRARSAASRHRTADVEAMADAVESPPDGPLELDVRPILHQELARLPGKYREPIVLCHLEGKSHEEAARLLSWPVGTVSGRLSRGRQLLKARLERRGVAVSSAMLASSRWLAGPAASLLSPPLIESTLAAAARLAAAGTIPTALQSLTQGVLRTMLFDKLKTASLALAAATTVSGGVVWTIGASRAANSPSPSKAAQEPPPRAVEKTATPSATPATAPAQTVVQPPPPLGAAMMGPPGGVVAPNPAMMSFQPPPLGKNAPNLVDPRHPLPVFRSQDILVVESPDRTSIQAMSLSVEGDGSDPAVWDRFTLPPGVTADPVIGPDTLAPTFKGQMITQVAAFSRYTGVWAVQKLKKPVEEEITPCMSPGGVIYQVGNDVYAFSARKGIWGALHLEGNEKPKVAASTNDIEVLQGNKLHVFSLNRGQWSPAVEMNLKSFQRNKPGPAPVR